jgi:hypothetical protein
MTGNIDGLALTHHKEPMNHVLQLPHIPRPVIAPECLEHGIGEAGRLLPQLFGSLAEEVLCQEKNVVVSVAKRWDVDAKHVDAEVEVLAEQLPAN